jgi:GTP cyclohydrolase I
MGSSINASKLILDNQDNKIVSQEEAEQAVKTLIRYIGEDPEREGLIETPKRVIKSFNEFYAGYSQDPETLLSKTFEDIEGYDDIVLLKNINFESHCEHHMVPIIGKASIGYYPNKRVVGISKLARVLDVFAKRLQTQETMTQQISSSIFDTLKPKGVAVYIEAFHQCMTTRGVFKPDVSTITNSFLGAFKDDKQLQNRFLDYIKS